MRTRIAVCQLAGRDLGDAPAALEACQRLVAEAGRRGADIAVLPEGAYPGYVLGSAAAARTQLAAGPDPIPEFGRMAQAAGLLLVAGLVRDEGAGLLNAAVAFAPDGTVIGRVGKRFLWHFDACWFAEGSGFPVWDTGSHGPIGAVVCADARLPEIPRLLAVGGAALICDPTAWVTSRPGAPTNIQPEFLIQARAIENGCVVAAASKCGFEGDTVAYTGRSMVVAADGTVLAEAPMDEECVVTADADLTGLPNPPVARRPELYAALADEQGATPGPPSPNRVRVAAANRPDAADPDRLGALAAQGVTLVVLPVGSGDPAALAARTDLWMIGSVPGGAVVASPGGTSAEFSAVHGGGGTATTLPEPVATPAGRVCVLPGDDALVPEQCRIAALGGAEVLVVTGASCPLPVLRARAAENRVFVVAAGSPAGGAVIVGPTGAVLADAPSDRAFICSADLFLPEAADKLLAPGTHVFAGRRPAAYGALIDPAFGVTRMRTSR